MADPPAWMGADSYTCQRRGLLVRPVRRRDPAGMDIHVEQRFKHHHALRGARLPMPAQAWQVVVETDGRQPWFSSFHVACEAVRAFRRASAGGDWTLLAWVLLADRAHWLLQPGASVPLTVAVSRMKATTGAGVNRMLARAGPLWEPAFDCRALGAAEDLRAAARRFVVDALREGGIQDPGHYPFWDCAWL